MTTNHMNPTPAEVLEDTEDLFMIMMQVLTAGPNARPHNAGWKQVYGACKANDKRWMNLDSAGALRTLSPAYYRALTADCNFEI